VSDKEDREKKSYIHLVRKSTKAVTSRYTDLQYVKGSLYGCLFLIQEKGGRKINLSISYWIPAKNMPG